MEEFFFNGIWRMDWGFGNPNKTAALIAMLMLAVWVLAYLRKWGFWVALTAFTALGVCLVHTFSRGGFIALATGLVPVLLMAPRPWPWKRIAGAVAAVWVVVGFSIYLQAHERMGQGVIQEDRSISNRLELWQSAPVMMLDAPEGWGLGNSGRMFMEWYQAPDRNEPYRTMVNSHLTWLVEFGWTGRFLYLAGWLLVFGICLPDRRSPWLAIPFGVWLAFFVSAVFSSVAEEPWLWLVPGGFLFVVVGWRFKTAIWPRSAVWFASPAVATLALLMVPLVWRGSEVHKSGNRIIVGKGDPNVWVVADEQVLGSSHGKTLRTSRQSDGTTVGIVSDLRDLPDVSDTMVILSGTFASGSGNPDFKALAAAETLVLANPAVFPDKVAGFETLGDNVTVVAGDFAQSPAIHAWAANFNTRRLPGTGDFIPNWPEQLLNQTEN